MTTRRMIDPELWQSETVASLTMRQRLLFIGLFSNADDQGRLRAHPALIRSLVFPYDDIALGDIETHLRAIAEVGCIWVYDVDGRAYIQVVNWWKYQSPPWAYPSHIPPMDGWRDRLRYRQGSETITRNWDGKGGFDTSPSTCPADTQEEGSSYPSTCPTPTLPDGQELQSPIDSIGLGLGLGLDRIEREGAKPADAEASPPPTPPPKPAPPKPKPEPKKPLHPAIQTFRTAVHRYPAKSWYDDIAAAVGKEEADLAYWYDVCHGYVGLGWNPKNVANMLEFFMRREIPKGGNRATGPRGGSTVDRMLALSEEG